MRNITPALLSHLQGECLTLAYCVKLTRRDGVIYAYTSHDEDLTISSVVYEANGSVDASEVASKIGTGVDNLDIIGLLDSERITHVDIVSGLFDDATVEMFAVNWTEVSQGTIGLLKGKIGNITVNDNTTFTCEVRSLSQRIQQQIGEVTTRSCRVKRFGDERCAPNGFFADGITTISSYQNNTSVLSVIDNLAFTALDVQVTGNYRFGVCTVTSVGLNFGIEREIKNHIYGLTGSTFILQEAFPFPLSVGDAIRLEQGCQRRFNLDCKLRFNNVVNFRGEPHVPSNYVYYERGRPNAEQEDEQN